VKTQGDPLTLARAVQQAVWSVDRDQPVWKIRTLSSLVDTSLGPRRLVASLLSGFALLVLLLATLGIYGTMTFVVQQRTQEIGIRMALGGSRFDVLRLVLGQGATLAVIGLALGLTTFLILAPLMRSLLFDTRARDPFTFILVGTLLLCAMLAASFLPARRAARVDPMIALRYE
jgi:ABC-type antimicrobial peptide transport system permease subunit